jgi:peptidoglycan/LPS O-acetylase OafA/YrhL
LSHSIGGSPEPEQRHEYFVQLDGLRGLAVTMVIVGHIGLGSADLLWPWLALARLGVLIFFVLSGFLITTILLDERAAFGNVDLRAFYIRRALRLLPAFLVFIASMACLKALGYVPGESWGSFVAALAYVRNIYGSGELLGHIWSLSIEEQFYFLWPALLLAFPRRALAVTCFVIIGITVSRAFGIAWEVFDANSGVFYMRPWFRFDSLMFGGLVAIIRRQRPALASSAALRRLTHPILVLPALVAASLPEVAGRCAPLHQAIENGLVTAFFVNVVVAPSAIPSTIA